MTTPWLFWPAMALFSLCVGSFLNVVILRLPQIMEQAWRRECEALQGNTGGEATNETTLGLATPRSHCPSCGATIGALDNIPVISYLLLRGRCRHCGTGISARYPIIEAITAALSIITVLVLGVSVESLIALLLVWPLIALTVIDLDTQLLPDSITLPLLWLGLIVNATGGYVSLEDAFWGAVAGYMSLWTIYQLFRVLTGKEGMGYGDFKLLAALGAWLGWAMLPAIVLLSSLVGAVVGIAMMAFRQHDRNIPIPFGPYLAAAGLLCLWWGPEIQQLWLRWLGA